MSIPTSQSLQESQKRADDLRAKIAYYPGLDYSKRELTLADKIVMRNYEQSARLAQAIDRVMSDNRLTQDEKIEEMTRVSNILQPIPQDASYFFRAYGYELAKQLDWYWSVTFGCWGCKVQFDDGYICSTYPKPPMIPISPELKEELTKLGFYDDWGNSELLIDHVEYWQTHHRGYVNAKIVRVDSEIQHTPICSYNSVDGWLEPS